MVERGATLVEITREAPCEGRSDELLRLATALRGESGGEATRRHVSKCARCRAFLDHARLGMRLAGDAFAGLEAVGGTRAKAPFDLTRARSFENWLDRALWSRGERDLAHAMARTARWLLCLDPDVTTSLVSSDDPVARVPGALSTANSFVNLLEREQTLCVPTERDRRLIVELRRDAARSPWTRSAQLTLVNALLARSLELSKGAAGFPWLVRALTEWYVGDEAKVPQLLETAARAACSADNRAAILLSHAVHRSEAGHGNEASVLLDRALAANPSPVVRSPILVTKLTWLATAGRFEALDRQMRMFPSQDQREIARQRNPPAVVAIRVASIAHRHGLSAERCELAVRRVVEALHGS
ncbi:MAG: hypothetical protein EXS13_14405 [Planctomycetes bacterium]|nr:hypothetical protein [Planctomycetota bacterium]